MSKIMVDIRSSDIGKFKDNDVLIYDENKKQFYKTTAETFFKEYELKLNALLKRYDEQFKTLKQENSKLNQSFEMLKTNLNIFSEQLVEKNKTMNEKLIQMVEDFIKTGGKI